MRLFKHIRQRADQASVKLAHERGPCLDAEERGIMQRFSHKLAIAPTASISIICGGTSACVEPIPTNYYTHKTLSGSFAVKNQALEKLLEEKGLNDDETWASILEEGGSVQHLDGLTADEKDVFKTAFELDQRWVIELAADRAPFICQSQSINIFLPGDVDKWDLHMLHWTAWERGVKSLYYCRSQSVQRTAYAGGKEKEVQAEGFVVEKTDYDECLACQ
jgi:ribonucleoside-diphosphate reductase alpha chain